MGPDCSRRRFLLQAAAATLAPAALAGCRPGAGAPPLRGGFAGPDFARGHRFRDIPADDRAPDETRRTGVAIVGAGVAGLAAARALAAAGVVDLRLFELEAEVGGNSRSGRIAGQACPWGAHYLPVPVPGPAAEDLAALLDELGLRRVVDGTAVYDERHLAHAPHERLWRPDLGRWQDGLVPVDGLDAATLAQYRRLAVLVDAERRTGRYALPTARARWNTALAALDAETFDAWLDRHGLTAAPLRWYLDYCCRDDYGAGSAHVSAWAGLHYFASRHGFHPPGTDRDDTEQVLTWPQGNGWLIERLAAPFADRTATGAMTRAVRPRRDGVAIDVLDAGSGRLVRWQAEAAILATPLFIAARLLAEPPEALRVAAGTLRHAPWLVANLHLQRPLASRRDQPGLCWDNVLYGSRSLGYVNAGNQSLRGHDGPTVLTCYRAFGDDPAAGRAALLARGWQDWAHELLAELAPVHPDLRAALGEIRIARYGHAMAIPAPGVRGSPWLAALAAPAGRIAFAHADLSGHSVFEEAFDRGLQAGRGIARVLAGRRA